MPETTPSRSPLAGRRVVLGVTGGIAAYKAVEVCRRLVDAGAHVAPIMTEGAQRFVGEVTFSALASEPVQTSLWDETSPIPHTRLGQGADLVVVCPATARLLGAYAAGISDDLLTATLLATRAPVVVCPAMHTEMWEHPAVQDNLRVLAGRGVTIVPPDEGRLAGGDVGAGRLADPEHIVAALEAALGPDDLAGLDVLITAGGTREPIDPVRFVGNRSSGKQGHALADEAVSRGAKVTLVTTVERPVAHGVEVVKVATAAEMDAAVRERSDRADVVVMAAAVADFRPGHCGGRQAEEGGRPSHGHPRADRRHPRRPAPAPLARSDPGRLRRRDRRRRRQRHGQAGPQARRPPGGERRLRSPAPGSSQTPMRCVSCRPPDRR